VSKIRAEGVIGGSGIPHVILRVAPVAVADLLEPPEVIPYREDQRVEFITVPEAALAFYNVATDPQSLGKTLNIAGGESWQMTGREYLEGFYGALGVEVELNFSEEYTAVDWYDTSKSRYLGYQRTSFNDFQRKLGSVAEELGLI
jgi:nucleoside-diphosphate-sugar epimerase